MCVAVHGEHAYGSEDPQQDTVHMESKLEFSIVSFSLEIGEHQGKGGGKIVGISGDGGHHKSMLYPIN